MKTTRLVLSALVLAMAAPGAWALDFKSAFNKLDTDHNGSLSAEELAAVRRNAPPVQVEVHAGSGGGLPLTLALPPPDGPPPDNEVAFVLPDGIAGNPTRMVDGTYRLALRVQADATSPDKAAEAMLKRQVTLFDTNGDGKIGLAEFTARQRVVIERGFETLDYDGDGSLTKDEYVLIATPPLEKLAGALGQDPDALQSLETAIAANAPVTADQLKVWFPKLDKDGNGKLTKKEYLPPA